MDATYNKSFKLERKKKRKKKDKLRGDKNLNVKDVQLSAT